MTRIPERSAKLMCGILLALCMTFAGCGCDRSQNQTRADAKVKPSSSESTPDAANGLSSVDQQYAALLKAIVDDEGMVRYEVLSESAHTTALEQIKEHIAANPVPDDAQMRKAWLCNAYNVNVLAMTLDARADPGFETVKKVAGFFDTAEITVGGERTTLEVLHTRIRELGDPRIHAALVAGAKSSPPLRHEPYQASKLNEQLDHQSRRWVDDSTRNTVMLGRIKISQIFDWYAKDFEVEPYKGATEFLRRHSSPNGIMRSYFKNVPEPQVTFLEFNWRLNQSLDSAGPKIGGQSNE